MNTKQEVKLEQELSDLVGVEKSIELFDTALNFTIPYYFDHPSEKRRAFAKFRDETIAEYGSRVFQLVVLLYIKDQ